MTYSGPNQLRRSKVRIEPKIYWLSANLGCNTIYSAPVKSINRETPEFKWKVHSMWNDCNISWSLL